MPRGLAFAAPRSDTGVERLDERHEDGTSSSRSTSLALEEARCTFEARHEPGTTGAPAQRRYGILRSAVRCVRGAETHAEESENGGRIAFTLGDDLAVRFDCTDTDLVMVISGK